MIGDRIYETETMAELCARQGRLGEAIAIYRQLVESATDPGLRARCRARLASLEATWRPLRDAAAPARDVPLPAPPGVTVHPGDDQITVAWALAPGTPAPVMEIFLVQRTPAGIETEKKTLPLDASAGRIGLVTPGLHSALAAVGTVVEGRFVPMARSRR